MRAALRRIWHLGVKELRSLKADPVLALLIVYTFTVGVYSAATGAKLEVRDASVAVVDEDRSALSFRLVDALLPPYFKEPRPIEARAVDAAMGRGDYVFVLQIPPGFEADVLSGIPATVGLAVDATAMAMAGNGTAYIAAIVAREVAEAVPERVVPQPVDVVVRVRFNPNLEAAWFTSVMQVILNVTILSVILAGAALIREREHGTVEHLLVMPVSPTEIMLGKVWANGLVIVLAALVSLLAVVEGMLAVPVAGSLALFAAAAVVYQFSVASLGILLATVSGSMAQFGLLAMPVLIAMNLLSGSSTPLESMPEWLQTVMQASPSTHFVRVSQAILYRGAGPSLVWPQFLSLAGIGLVFLALARLRFRHALLAS